MRAIHSSNGVESGDTLSIVYVSVDSFDAESFADACRGLGWLDVGIVAVCGNSRLLDSDEERFADVFATTRTADLVILKIHGDRSNFLKFDRLFAAVEKHGRRLLLQSTSPLESAEFRHMFPFPDDGYNEASALLEIGGVRNYTSLFLWACREILGRDIRVPEPEVMVSQGICRPPADTGFREDRFFESLDPSAPTVGLLVNQSVWIRQDMAAVDRLKAALESRGANVIPVFFRSSRSEVTGSIGIEGCLKRYFMKGRKSRVDVIINASGFSQRILGSSEEASPFAAVGVPVINAPAVFRPVREWEDDSAGLNPSEMSFGVVQTEYDGQIATVPLQFQSGMGNSFKASFVEDRVERIAGSAMAWCNLRRKERANVRVAVILNAGSRGTMGYARGLAPLESLRKILGALSRRGYRIDYIPKSQKDLERMLSPAVDPVAASPGDADCYRPASVSRDRYRLWFDELPRLVRERMNVDSDPGFWRSEDGLPVQGVVDGNVFIGLEPDPGIGPHHAVSHEYMLFYRWIEKVFRADAVVHLGDRGSLDGLPGKWSGLSSQCLPDAVLGSAVRICLYAVDDPAGCALAKRRAHSVVIGHLTPPESGSAAPSGMEELEVRLQEVMRLTAQGASVPDEEIAGVRRLMDGLHLWTEVGLKPDVPPGELVEAAPNVYNHMARIREDAVQDGLHVFGVAPRGRRLAEAVWSAMRVPNGPVQSMMEALAGERGLDLAALAGDPSGTTDSEFNGSMFRQLEKEARGLVSAMADLGFSKDACMELAKPSTDGLADAVVFICDDLVPRIRSCSGELNALLDALEGRFVEPGPAGTPYCGAAHVLPTGRNVHSIDALRLPTEAGWIAGSAMADEMVARYVRSEGRYPERMAVVVNGGSTMANGGIDISCAIRLVGLRPCRASYGGRVTGLDAVPLEELGRPRVAVRLCVAPGAEGQLASVLGMYEQAVRELASMDEGDEAATMGGGLKESIAEYIKGGIESGPVDVLVAGRSSMGPYGDSDVPRLLRAVRREAPGAGMFVMEDRSSHRPEVRDITQDASRMVRDMFMSPSWMRSLIPLGFDGAAEVARTVSRMLEWGGVGGVTEPWMFKAVSDSVVFDKRVRAWMLVDNPQALCEIMEDLFEAAKKGLWTIDGTTASRMREVFLDAEGAAEERGVEWRGERSDESRAQQDLQVGEHLRDRAPHERP